MFKKESITKKHKIIAILAVVIIGGGIAGYFKFYKPEPKRDYEALVSVREMSGAGSAEEKARSAMYPGDVIAIKEGAGNWSATERASYLIVKLHITASDAGKLTSPLTQKVSGDKVDGDIKRMKEGNPNISKDELKRYEDEARNREDTIKQRKYGLNLEKILPKNFDPNSLVKGQPLEGKSFGWGVVEKR